jgi:phytoene dehydrogenase-like protein
MRRHFEARSDRNKDMALLSAIMNEYDIFAHDLLDRPISEMVIDHHADTARFEYILEQRNQDVFVSLYEFFHIRQKFNQAENKISYTSGGSHGGQGAFTNSFDSGQSDWPQ